MQICLKSKLKDDEEYLAKYAQHFAKSNRIKLSMVGSKIINDFEESPDFVRKHLPSKFKNQSKVSYESKLTRLRNKIIKDKERISIAEVLYESMVNQKK